MEYHLRDDKNNALQLAPLVSGFARNRSGFISRFDAPLFGHDTLIASHDEDFVVSHHCKRALRGTPMKSLADSVILAKRKDLIARNQKALHQQSGVE